MEIPYYGDVNVNGEPFCAGCVEMDLTVTTNKIWANCEVAAVVNLIECSSLRRCRNLYKRMNQAVQNNTTKESEEKS